MVGSSQTAQAAGELYLAWRKTHPSVTPAVRLSVPRPPIHAPAPRGAVHPMGMDATRGSRLIATQGRGIGVAGTGSHVPATIITNQDLAGLINQEGKGADWARQKLGIEGRRFMTPLDCRGRPTAEADELDMAEMAARNALASAAISPAQVDGLWYVSCTQQGYARRHFSRSAFELHQRLGLRSEAVPIEMDAGCGGALHAMVLGGRMMAGGGMDTMLVVAANAPSRYYGSWESYVAADVWLSMYIFGDGAGAMVLRRSEHIPSGSRIVASYLGVDPNQPLMSYEPRSSDESLYVIDARSVANSFGIYAKQALEGLQREHAFEFGDIARFYFHQVNGMVLMKFVEKMGLPPERVAMHVERYGNIAAAAMLVLLDEDRKKGIVGDGDLVVFCTVGAGAQFGAALVRL